MIVCARLLFAFFCCVFLSTATRAVEAPAPAVAVPSPPAGDADATDETAPPKIDPGAEKYWQAVKVLWSNQPAEQAEGRRLLVEAADLEFTHAQLLLGECYQGGSLGFRKDVRKGAAMFRLAAERGNGFAEVSYGMCLFGGMGVRKDAAKAGEWLTAAVAADADFSRPVPPANYKPSEATGSDDSALAGATVSDPVANAQARAHYVLGVLLEREKKMTEAQPHYVAAATAGPAGREGIQGAAVQAAINYAFGHGVPRDLAKANAMLDQSRKLVRRSAISLVHNFANQKRVDDFAVAELEEEIARASDDAATELQFQIGQMFGDRKSKDYDPREAVRWFELAAESKKPWAMLELAFIHTRGDLGAADPAQAFAWFEKAGADDRGNHILGTANTAICLLRGIGTAADPARAAALFQKYRDSDIVCYLGVINQAPATVVTHDGTAALNELWAKKKNDPHAQFLLGLRYARGQGVPQDADDAERWWKRAARAGSASACRELGLHYERAGPFARIDGQTGLTRAVENYRLAVDRGDARAHALLAYMYQFGRGVDKSETDAERLYEKALALDPKSAMAANNLGAIFEYRFRRELENLNRPAAVAHRDKMLELYRQADEAGSAQAAFNLGGLHREGVLGAADFVEAYSYFDKAAERGHAGARYQLGQMHEKGEGVDVTYSEAAYHYRLAALDGHLEALRRLIQFYIRGTGVSQDFDRALFWLGLLLRHPGQFGALVTVADLSLQKGEFANAVKLLNALKVSDVPAIAGFAYERLSRCYLYGWGVKARPDRAKAYLEKALQLGDHDAEYRVAMERMKENKPAEAIVLFEKAAVSSSDACFALGQMRFFGQHGDKDLPRAWAFFRQAAEKNHPAALYFLAGTAFNQVEGAPTLDEAILFAETAEQAGHPKAAALREKLERRRQAQDAKPESDSGTRSL